MIDRPYSECTTPEEWSQVSLQHLPEYEYTTICNRQVVMDFHQENKKYKEEMKFKESKEEDNRK